MPRPGMLSLVALILACSPEQPAPPSSSPPPKPVEVSTAPMAPKQGFFMAEGAPEPRACTAASECLGDTIPDLDNPCCQNPRTLEPYSRPYRKWIQEWRGEHCDEVTCPQPPAPSLPPDCAFEVECVDGQCVDSCP